jgi:aminoglycoside phosphotransferase (APT) family kinase protein
VNLAERTDADERTHRARTVAPAGDPDAITAGWLTAALFEGGLLQRGRVRAAEVEPLGIDRGLTGRVARVRLSYEGAAEGAPASLVAKFAAAPGATRSLAERFDLYQREAEFYRHLASRCPTPAPRLYFASKPGEPFALLLEDLEHAREIDLLTGCSLDQAANVVSMLAETHARFWNDPALAAHSWLPSPNHQVIIDLIAESSVDSWRRFRADFGTHMPDALVRLGNRTARDRSVLDRLSDGPWTLVHGDMRAHNIMFDPSAPGKPLAVIDWQTAMRARGPVDVASLFVSSVTPGDRRIAEAELLPAYHAALVARGVDGYAYDECWRDW